MKNNTPPVSKPVSQLIWKLALIGGGILIMVMLVLTTRSIIGVFRPSSSLPAVEQTNSETMIVNPKPSAGTPLSSDSGNFGAQISPLSAPDNSQTAASPASRPTTFAVEVEIVRQREQARTETIEALKRQAQEQAGTNEVSKAELKKLEQSDPYIQ